SPCRFQTPGSVAACSFAERVNPLLATADQGGESPLPFCRLFRARWPKALRRALLQPFAFLQRLALRRAARLRLEPSSPASPHQPAAIRSRHHARRRSSVRRLAVAPVWVKPGPAQVTTAAGAYR